MLAALHALSDLAARDGGAHLLEPGGQLKGGRGLRWWLVLNQNGVRLIAQEVGNVRYVGKVKGKKSSKWAHKGNKLDANSVKGKMTNNFFGTL